MSHGLDGAFVRWEDWYAERNEITIEIDCSPTLNRKTVIIAMRNTKYPVTHKVDIKLSLFD